MFLVSKLKIKKNKKRFKKNNLNRVTKFLVEKNKVTKGTFRSLKINNFTKIINNVSLKNNNLNKIYNNLICKVNKNYSLFTLIFLNIELDNFKLLSLSSKKKIYLQKFISFDNSRYFLYLFYFFNIDSYNSYNNFYIFKWWNSIIFYKNIVNLNFWTKFFCVKLKLGKIKFNKIKFRKIKRDKLNLNNKFNNKVLTFNFNNSNKLNNPYKLSYFWNFLLKPLFFWFIYFFNLFFILYLRSLFIYEHVIFIGNIYIYWIYFVLNINLLRCLF